MSAGYRRVIRALRLQHEAKMTDLERIGMQRGRTLIIAYLEGRESMCRENAAAEEKRGHATASEIWDHKGDALRDAIAALKALKFLAS